MKHSSLESASSNPNHGKQRSIGRIAAGIARFALGGAVMLGGIGAAGYGAKEAFAHREGVVNLFDPNLTTPTNGEYKGRVLDGDVVLSKGTTVDMAGLGNGPGELVLNGQREVLTRTVVLTRPVALGSDKSPVVTEVAFNIPNDDLAGHAAGEGTDLAVADISGAEVLGPESGLGTSSVTLDQSGNDIAVTHGDPKFRGDVGLIVREVSDMQAAQQLAQTDGYTTPYGA